eukprot:CAMPEP_0201594682 /NCGR_PEP_ID=MMETSP0190_2-20130828/191919_1 /ASSEMBLY_ACC=CAM_ASM_000263 /TAXON_ID=37353 /ORGANISM="Rosalina sp." /LENGTH=679 /DNA_ID=CAMNT_0048054389 /DNA_START=898 /DNA_END=2937 /DNA_ORIENTATION=-
MLLSSRKHATTDDLATSSLSNLRDVDYDKMIYGNGLLDGTDLIDNLDPKHEKQVMQRMHANWKREAANKDKGGNSIILEDKTFWDEILSSDSSETEDDMGLGIIYANDMAPKKKRKKRHKDGARDLYKKTKNKHSKNDSSRDLTKQLGGNDYGTKLFSNNPKKSGRRGGGKSKRVSFKTVDPSQDKVTRIDYRKKKDSVFLDHSDIDGLDYSQHKNGNNNGNNNTIQRNKLPDRRGARKSRFGMHDTKPLLQRKSSTFNENAYGETFKITQEQLHKISNEGIWPDIQQDLEEYGVVSLDKDTPALKLVLSEGEARDKAVGIIEKYLGSITGVDKKSPISIDKPSKEIVFPLTDDQLRQVTNPHHLKMLMDDLTHFGTIGVDEGFLKLKIPLDLPTITPIHKLEKRLGVLLTVQEIKDIRSHIAGDEKSNTDANINIDDIDVLKVNDLQFINHMMKCCKSGVKFIKHKKRGVYDERFVLIDKDRLYWKEKQEERNHRSRSMHLTKIIQVMIGKNTKALRDDVLKDTLPICCFSVVAKKATLDLSSPQKDPIQVREFTAYLKGLQRHFISQASQFMQQTPNNRSHHPNSKHSSRSNGHSSRSNGHGHGHGHGNGHHGNNGHHGHHGHHKHNNQQQQQKPPTNSQQNGKMKLSPIGQGFGGFKFDDQTLNKMTNPNNDNDKQ